MNIKRVVGIVTVPLVCFALLFQVGCSGTGKIEALYHKYSKALSAGDINTLKECLAADSQQQLLQEDAQSKLELIRSMKPTQVSVKSVKITADSAVIELEGTTAGTKITGTAQVRKENGDWKIVSEQWTMNMDAASQPVVASGDSFFSNPGIPPQATLILEGHQGDVSGLAFTADGRYLVSFSYNDYSIRVWDPYNGRELSFVTTPKRVRSLVVTPDGTKIYTADAYKQLTVWTLDQGTIGAGIVLSKKAGDFTALSPDGKLIAVTAYQQSVSVWKSDEFEWIITFGEKPDRRVLTFSPTGSVLAAGGSGNSFGVWDTTHWKEKRIAISKISADSEIFSIDISADEKFLATGHSDSSIVISDLKKFKVLHNFFVPQAATWCVRFSPDVRLLATAQEDGNVYIWKTETAAAMGTLSKHTGAVKSLAFSPDGRMLVSGGADRKIIIWSDGPVQPREQSSTPTSASSAISTGEPQTGGSVHTIVEGKKNLLGDTNAGRITPLWRMKGDTSFASDDQGNMFVIKYSGMFYQDVPLKDDMIGKYALLIAWASTSRYEGPHDQTGLPYIYGYMMNKTDGNKINAYLKDQLTLLQPAGLDTWGVIWGIYEIPPDTGSIRFFMQQADGKSAQNGSEARFSGPGVFIFGTEAEAKAFTKLY